MQSPMDNAETTVENASLPGSPGGLITTAQ